MKSNLNDKAVDEFLNSQTKEGTFKSYKTVMKQYLEYTGKTGQELLDIKRQDKDFQVENSMLNYRKHILSKGKSENYAVGSIMTIRGFYSYYRMPLIFRRQESKKLREKNRTTTDYLFDKEDLARMALVGDLKSRYVLLVGKSIGLRASDFVKLTYGTFRSVKLENEAPLALGEIATQKESIKAYPFLDSDAIPIVKAWLDSHKDAKDNDRIIEDTENNLTIILQTLAKKAGMEIDNGAIHGKRVRFHCLRKFLIDRLSAYASESQWKQIVGKSIDEGAYVSQDQLKGVFSRAMKDLLINGNGLKTKKLIELENALRAVENENAISKTRIDNLQKSHDDLERQFKELYFKKLMFIEEFYPMTIIRTLTDPKTGETIEWEETANNPQEEIKLSELYMEKRRKLGIKDE
jgi:site-specific recombinase XerD